MRSSYTGNNKVINFSKLFLKKNRGIYHGNVVIAGKKLNLFSVVVSRNPVCDLCHGIHFIITFNDKGTILNFTPIHLTKYGNELWNEEDTNVMKETILGGSVKKGFKFNPDVDAVSTATITSILIIDSINKLHGIIKEIKSSYKDL